MKPRTLRAWTRRLLTIGMYACILSLFFGEKVQAFSLKQPQYYDQITKKDTTKTSEDSSEVTVIEKAKNPSAVLLFTGDLMCLGGQQNAACKKNEFNFCGSFSYVRPLFSSVDLVVGNLETLISKSNPYTYKQKSIYGNPNCNAMDSYLNALIYAGVGAVVTANNHTLDGGETGVKETIEQLEKKHIPHTGTYADENQQQYLLCEVNGIKVAILSYTELINARSILPAKQVGELISCYSKEKVEEDVKAAKEAGAEFIVAYNHWGTENTNAITTRQQQHAKEMAEAGVDLILGSHPHCLQKAEYITTSDGRDVLCMYSMGNFVSSMTREINTDTIALEVVLHKNISGVYTGSIGYYPMKIIRSYQKKSYVIMPIRDDNKVDKTYEKKLEQARKRIEKVIGTQISSIH